MTRHLLDTDTVIDFLYNIADTVQYLRRLFVQGDTLCSCAIVLAEIYAGLHPHEQARAEAFLSTLEFLPASAGAARQAGAWRYRFMRQGQTLPVTDCLIAAVAVSHQASVITGNVKDFPMQELTLLPLPRVQEGGAR